VVDVYKFLSVRVRMESVGVGDEKEKRKTFENHTFTLLEFCGDHDSLFQSGA
jgi:hypothetical protein